MKIAVTTFFTHSYESLAALTIPVLQRWCDKHGYDLHINKISNDTFPHFVKTADSKRLLEDGYDLIFAIENDILLTNLNYKIEDFINDTHDFFVTNDVNGLNTGSYIIRQSEWARKWLAFINNRNDGTNDEQDVFQIYCDSYIFKDKICTISHPSINSIAYKYYDSHGYVNYNGQPLPTEEMGNWVKGNFCCHLPGMELNRRIELFNEIKKDIIYE